MTLEELRAGLRSSAAKVHSPDESDAIARIYLEDKFGIKRASPLTESQSELPSDRMDEITRDLELLSQGVPVQYITGVQWFGGHIYKVNKNVLIPRPETEELVELISNELKLMKMPLILLDVGTGSGCIPVTLKLKFPMITAIATDISAGALEVARFNAQNLNAEVTFVEDDILSPLYVPNQKFDFIVSNPPYIPYSEAEQMDHHVVGFEPHTALFAPDKNPLIYYSAVLNYSLSHLKPGGFLYFEIHQIMGRDVVKLPEMNQFADVQILKDMSGNARFIKAVLKKS